MRAGHPSQRKKAQVRGDVTLCFLRHGASDPPESAPDEARQLTKDGRRALRRAGPLLHRLQLRPELLICSPRQRAIESAQILQAAGLGGHLVVDSRLAPGAAWADIARVLADHPGLERVLLVGHEPDLSRSIQLLTGAAAVKLRAGGLCCVRFEESIEPGVGVLTLLLDPAVYGT